jgi:MtN3 and saliva related transmembrane protein
LNLPMDLISWTGGLAAALTSLAYIPQVRKAWPRGSTKDVSLKMLVALTSGLILWVVYGLLQKDWILVLANSVGTALAATVLCCKIRDARAGR